MGNRLDTVLVEELVEGPLTVNTDYETVAVDIMNREAECSIQLIYSNGVNVDMTITLEASSDGVNYATVTDSEQAISDPSGSHLMDIVGTGANYLRVRVAVAAGSIDIQRVFYSGKQRH